MKFFAFFAVIATVSAEESDSKIYPSTTSNCAGQDIPTISECGKTNLPDYNISGAEIVYINQTINWFELAGCGLEGNSANVDRNYECYELPFVPRCVTINC